MPGQTSIIVGNCLDELRKLEAESVHCAVSSPPYWGLRDYGIEPTIWGGDPVCDHQWGPEVATIAKGGQTNYGSSGLRNDGRTEEQRLRILETCKPRGETPATGSASCTVCGAWRGALGLEQTPELFIDHLAMVFDEVRRVLRSDGTLWMNLGDTYSAAAPNSWGDWSHPINGVPAAEASLRFRPRPPDLKPKDLVGIPWMAAFELRRRGWFLRQDVIWQKPNPMPESTTDRCTKAHEYIFLMTKSASYYYDAVAIAEDVVKTGTPGHLSSGRNSHQNVDHTPTSRSGNKARKPPSARGVPAGTGKNQAGSVPWEGAKRNKRSVWTVATMSFPEAHFATFPPLLIEPCIEAGTSERGCCIKCRTPWERITTKSRSNESGSGKSGVNPAGKAKPPNPRQYGTDDDIRNGPVITTITLGWYPACDCDGLPELPAYPDKPNERGALGVVPSGWRTASNYHNQNPMHERAPDVEVDEAALAKWKEDCAAVDEERSALCDRVRQYITVRAVVLDPFGGAGTTGLVAQRKNRDAVLIEQSPVYAKLARTRIDADAMSPEASKRHMAKELGKAKPFEEGTLFFASDA